MCGNAAGKGSKDASDRQLEPRSPTTSSQGPSAAPTSEASGAVRHVRSADLFGNAREVVIEHEHHRYRLKMTSRGGLILNK
ncbi:MAG TPA: hemin uptake protein HemP [Candidatus Angelobacter sp.]|nr:hemin uptake protein HemP [Candidatus Angelobacter sp.]